LAGKKLKSDEVYQEKQAVTQKAWREQHPDYNAETILPTVARPSAVALRLDGW
jgi:hypothetical protein